MVYQLQLCQELIDLRPSLHKAREFCISALAVMTEGDIFDVVNHHSRQGRLACIHLRSVRGEVPFHEKMFIDDGNAGAMGALRIQKQNRFVGVIIPGQAPQLACLVFLGVRAGILATGRQVWGVVA